MIRISFVVSESTFAALSRAADVEQHDLRQQASLMITEGLLRRGLLENEEDLGRRAEVMNPLLAGNGVEQIISTAAATSTRGSGHARM